METGHVEIFEKPIKPEQLNEFGRLLSEYCQETGKHWRMEIKFNEYFSDYDARLFESESEKATFIFTGKTRELVLNRVITWLKSQVKGVMLPGLGDGECQKTN